MTDGHAAVIGSGVIGGAWAARLVLSGVDVLVADPAPGAADVVGATIADAARAWRRLGLPTDRRGSWRVVESIAEAVGGARMIQESVPERLDVKRAVLAEIEQAAPTDVVIASSTSGLLPSEMQASMSHPERLVVGHPYNPVYLLPVVEVVGGEQTAPAVVDRAVEWYRSVGMEPVPIDVEIDAFVGDRLLEALWREALWLVADGVATTGQIDTIITHGFGLRWAQMGLFDTYRVAGGQGGFRHFLEQFGPALDWPWTKLTDTPEFTAELVERIVSQSDGQPEPRDVATLRARRDENLVDILLALEARSWGAGSSLAAHRARLDGAVEEAAAAEAPSTPDFACYPSHPEVAAATVDDEAVEVVWADGERARFHHLWLRDNATDPTSIDPISRERLYDICDLPFDVRAESVDVEAGQLRVGWSDGADSRYHPGWLRAHRYDGPTPQAADPAEVHPVAWSPHHQARVFEWSSVLEDARERRSWLETVLADGLSVLTGGPLTSADFQASIQRLLLPRNMNWGMFFDVHFEPDGAYISNRAIAIAPHVDAPTREYMPGVQVFHCLENTVAGGDSAWVDGIAVAEELRRTVPDAFELLATVPWASANRSPGTAYRNDGPIIAVDDSGAVVEIRHIHWLREPLAVEPDLVMPMYRAYRTFAELLRRPEWTVRRRLEPGETAVIDNRRLLHARGDYGGTTGTRWMQACYSEREELVSALRMITRAAPSPLLT